MALDAVAVSPVGAGAVLDDDPPCESGSMGGVLVELVNMGAVLVAFVDEMDVPLPVSPPSGGDCAETADEPITSVSSTNASHASVTPTTPIVSVVNARGRKGVSESGELVIPANPYHTDGGFSNQSSRWKQDNRILVFRFTWR